MRAALVACVCLLAAACGTTAGPAAAVSPGSPQGSASATRIAQPPVTPPTAPGDTLPAFNCSDAGGGSTGVAGLTAARMAELPGFDRFVLQFDHLVPPYTVKRQANPVFSTGPGGQTVSLSGTAGVLVAVQSATAVGTFTGSTDLTHTEYLVLREARQTQDTGKLVAWGLGLTHAACFRTFILADPARLVVDFSTS
jgi:hypothetical protein